jgi:1,4-alpha-glucan branching enzyme
LLAQSSDWAFQIYQGTTVEYSTRRFQSHIHRFNLLDEMLTGKSDAFTRESAGDEAGSDVSSRAAAGAFTPEGVTLTDHQLALLAEIESRDNIFPELDFRVYCP